MSKSQMNRHTLLQKDLIGIFDRPIDEGLISPFDYRSVAREDPIALSNSEVVCKYFFDTNTGKLVAVRPGEPGFDDQTDQKLQTEGDAPC